MTLPRLILHTGAAGIIFYGYNSLKRLQVYPEMEALYGGFWQYLTIQGYAPCLLYAFARVHMDRKNIPRRPDDGCQRAARCVAFRRW